MVCGALGAGCAVAVAERWRDALGTRHAEMNEWEGRDRAKRSFPPKVRVCIISVHGHQYFPLHVSKGTVGIP